MPTVLLIRHGENEYVKKHYTGNLDKDDSFDYQSLIKMQTKLYTNVSFEAMIEKIAQTRALGPERGTSGFDFNH